MVKICNLAINKDKVINNLNLNNNLLTIIKALQLQQHQMEVRHLVVLLQLLLLQLKLHLLHQVIYTPANVLGMYMTELVVKSVVLGEMLITGRVHRHGYTVNNTPEKGSILQTSEGSYGHVAYVESVGSNGSVTVSEMNYSGGPYVKDTRTISLAKLVLITTSICHNFK